MDIVDDLRDLNSMHTPNEVSGIADEAADEIERLREALRIIAEATHSDWFSMKEAARAALNGDE